MSRNTFWVAAMATSAIATLAAGAARADETTIIREHKVVQTPAPEPQPAPVTTTVHHSTSVSSRTTSSDRVVTPHRIVHRHRVVHHAATTVAQRQPMAPPQAPAADQAAQPTDATIDRKTVIHRDDNGDVSRHTVIEKQAPDGSQTTIEHHSTSTPDDVPPHG